LIFVYKFNEELGEFEEIEIKENVPLFELLDSNNIFLFVDVHEKNVWNWHGKNTSTRSKFISAQEAPKIRDKHDISFMIHSIDEDEETAAFKVFVGHV
jgi:hypothetical protein